jgi:hypothetical protein
MENLEMLTDEELVLIDAGDNGFWYDVAYGVGRAAKAYWTAAAMYGGTAAAAFR